MMFSTFWLAGPEWRHDSARPGSLTHSRGNGSGREADPVQTDGMRAPPATEADPDVEPKIVKDEANVEVDEVRDLLFRSFLAALSGPLDSGCILPSSSAALSGPLDSGCILPSAAEVAVELPDAG